MAESSRVPPREAGAIASRRLGRGLESLSPLLFSGGARGAAAPEAAAPETAASRLSSAPQAPIDAPPAFSRPSTLLVTGFRSGCGKSFVASGVATECARGGVTTGEWQLGPGVVVPREGTRFGLPVPHPSERESFRRFTAAAADASVLILDGDVTLLADGDPVALAAEEFLVVASPGREGAAEAYAVVKEIFRAVPDAPVRVLVNGAYSQSEAREVFHLIADVGLRHLGRAVRSYGGLPRMEAEASPAAAPGVDARALVFTRIARGITARSSDGGGRRSSGASFFERVWSFISMGGPPDRAG